VRCAPPANKPTPDEIATCQPYLLEEIRLLTDVRVVVGLGRIGWRAYLEARRALGRPVPRPLPDFAHDGATTFTDGVTLLASYHPSQQNTFTGRLTRPMLRRVFEHARRILDAPATPRGPEPVPPSTSGGSGARRPVRTLSRPGRRAGGAVRRP
jgi:uracil-DNA glycosylase family 4